MPYWTSFLPDARVPVHLASTTSGICRLSIRSSDTDFTNQLQLQYPSYTWIKDPQGPLLQEAMEQVSSYFRRTLQNFDLPLDLNGTEFQRKVWRALQEIPYGHTRTYAEIARIVGSPKAVRAVGGANHVNPVPIIVPCHRVLAANGQLGGFACGLDYKRLLLDVERMAATI
ncbi:MAG: methylated-DNA--[protein]-cysteine S-methyltransferase [Bryobacteraceae bacterium]